jgi:hypothetical protein
MEILAVLLRRNGSDPPGNQAHARRGTNHQWSVFAGIRRVAGDVVVGARSRGKVRLSGSRCPPYRRAEYVHDRLVHADHLATQVAREGVPCPLIQCLCLHTFKDRPLRCLAHRCGTAKACGGLPICSLRGGDRAGRPARTAYSRGRHR